MDRLAALEKLEEGVTNRAPERLLEQLRAGMPRWLPLELGFLRIEYMDGVLRLISFVLEDDEHARAIGARLEFAGRDVTLIEENAVSGTQWSAGVVSWGHTYDDSSPSPGRKIALDAWVDESVQKMVNPGRELIAPLIAAERSRRALPGIRELLSRHRKGKPLHDLVEKEVGSREEIELLVAAVEKGLKGGDKHLVAMAMRPLAASRVEPALALTRLTDCMVLALEGGDLSAAESMSFQLEDFLARADEPTLARLRRLAPRLKNECLARGLEALDEE